MTKSEYVKSWQKTHYQRVRMHKIAWYYRNRKMINLMFSKPKGIEVDEVDKWYAEKNPKG